MRNRKLQKSIEFKNLDFKYLDRERGTDSQFLLENVEAKFETDKPTAIVGKSSQGKAAILHLILRFFDPQKGKVLIDHDDLSSLSLLDWRRQVSYISRDQPLFNNTLEFNLTLKPEYTHPENESTQSKEFKRFKEKEGKKEKRGNSVVGTSDRRDQSKTRDQAI